MRLQIIIYKYIYIYKEEEDECKGGSFNKGGEDKPVHF